LLVGALIEFDGLCCAAAVDEIIAPPAQLFGVLGRLCVGGRACEGQRTSKCADREPEGTP
jgi:hypothetical protein